MTDTRKSRRPAGIHREWLLSRLPLMASFARERDELLAALEEARQRCDCEANRPSLCAGCLADDQLLARIRAGK